MGFFSEEMAPMLGVYETETSSLMAGFDAAIARVEKAGAFSDEDIAELFRSAHTIKGSSAMMGLDGLARLTHRVEDLFDLLRGDPSLGTEHLAMIMDDLYSFSDFIKDELGRMEQSDYAPDDVEELVEAITADIDSLSGKDADGSQKKSTGTDCSSDDAVESSAPVKADALSDDGVALQVSFNPDVVMVNARALVILRQLETKLKVLSRIPFDLTDPKAAEAILKDGLILSVMPQDVDTARLFLAKNSSIRRITILDEAATLTPAREDSHGSKIGTAANADKFVTLRWESVNALQDMAGEFLLEISRLKARCADVPEEYGVRTAVLRASRLVDNLVYHINTMAMVSVSALVPQLSRMVRDMCRQSGKSVAFEVHGGDIEIDRNLYNSISDPLLHIIRNSVDHGIEQSEQRLAQGKEARGKIALSVESLGGRVVFRVADDGCGIDTAKLLAKAQSKGLLEKPAELYTREEALGLIMKAGLSTSDAVTQYSGRGVGMDVVSVLVRDFDGRIEIESEIGQGTTISLFMAVSVTSVECLGFRIGPVTCYLALANLDKIYRADESADRLTRVGGSLQFTHKKRQIPVLDMHDIFCCSGNDGYYVVCHSMQNEFALIVDDVLGEFTCANKPLPACLEQDWQIACGIRNNAIFEDGSVTFALNAAILASLSRDAGFGHQGDRDYPDWSCRFVKTPKADIPAQLLLFELGEDRYAVDVDMVDHIMPMPDCASAPRAPRHLKGLANYRNHVVPVFDLAASAGVKEASSYVLILSGDDGSNWGFAVTNAIGVRNTEFAEPAEVQPEQRHLACGLMASLAIDFASKEPPVTLLVAGQ